MAKENYKKAIFLMSLIREFQGKTEGFTKKRLGNFIEELGENANSRRLDRIIQALKISLGEDMFEAQFKDGRKTVWLIRGAQLNNNLTLDELNAFYTALKAFQESNLTYHTKNLNLAINKVTNHLIDNVELDVASGKLNGAFEFISHPRLCEKIEERVQRKLQSAFLEHKNVELIYRNNKIEKDVFPHGFIIYEGSLYLVSARHQGKKSGEKLLIKYIKMSEIYDVKFIKIDGNEFFCSEGNVSMQKIARKSFGICNERILKFNLHFNKNIANVAKKYKFQEDQEIEENEDGSCNVIFTGVGVLDLSWFLCRFGKSVQVIEPANFKELAEKAQQEFEENGCQSATSFILKEGV